GPRVHVLDGLAVAGLQVEGEQVALAGGLAADHGQEEVGLGDGVVLGVAEVVGAAHDVVLGEFLPVAGEGLVLEVDALGGLDDAELGAAGGPVVGGLPVGDVLAVRQFGGLCGGCLGGGGECGGRDRGGGG